MKSVLVTGGAGFIGSHLVKRLIENSVQVRVLDNLTSGSRDNLTFAGRRVEFVEGDIRNAIACRNACRDVDAVFHLAALVSPSESVQDPIKFDSVNTGGTLNLLMAARDSGVRRFVFSSSAAIYGDTAVIPTPEGVLPDPKSPYGVQKLTGEYYARNFMGLYELETVCLRYFNVYGPRQNPNSQYSAVIPRFITCMLSGHSPTVYGDGEQTRDFCSVEDVVNANLLAAQTTNQNAFGGVFNVASGVRISLNMLINAIQETLGISFTTRYEAGRAGDIRHSGADITHARTVLNYAPQVSLPTGLKTTIEAFKSTSTIPAISVSPRT